MSLLLPSHGPASKPDREYADPLEAGAFERRPHNIGKSSASHRLQVIGAMNPIVAPLASRPSDKVAADPLSRESTDPNTKTPEP
jgi:hypothetical protein